MRKAVLLSGEHPSLPAAELRALLDVHAPGAAVQVHGLVATVDPPEPGSTPATVDAALGRMALAHAWGDLWGDAPDTPDGLALLRDLVGARADGRGSAAVVTERRGRDKTARSMEAETALGQALKDAGHRIRLEAPERTIFAWFGDGRIHAGEQLGANDRSAFEGRDSQSRAHFSPVSLHPRRAAALLHLARAPPGGRVYDPFCGTGTFVLEAALEGYEAIGSDLDAFMVQGTLQTLADAGPQPLPALVFEADVGATPELVGHVDAIVTDLPYGRASGTAGEGLAAMYGRALQAIAALLRPGGHAVLGCADDALLGDTAAHGLAFVERHEERVHRSLTRRFIVVKRVQGLAGHG